MKKIALLLIAGFIFFSCGKEKKEVEETKTVKESLKTSLILDAVYIKDDTIKVFYKQDNFFNYDNPTVVQIKGSDSIQRIVIDMPMDVAVENFSIVASTNKDQKTLVVKNISVQENDVIVFDGSDYKHTEYFLSDESFSWDEENQRCNLTHTNKYPPGIVGSEKLEMLLVK